MQERLEVYSCAFVWGGGHAVLVAVRTVAALRHLGTAPLLLSGSVPR